MQHLGIDLPPLTWLEPRLNRKDVPTPVILGPPGGAGAPPAPVFPGPAAPAAGAPVPAPGPGAAAAPAPGAGAPAPAPGPGAAAPVGGAGGAQPAFTRAGLEQLKVTATDAVQQAQPEVVELTKPLFAFLDGRVHYNPDCRKRVLEKLGDAHWFKGTPAGGKRQRTYAPFARLDTEFDLGP